MWPRRGGAGGQGLGQAAEQGWEEPMCRVPCLSCRNPTQGTGWTAWRGGSSAEPGLVVLVASKSNSRQQCALAAVEANWLLGCISQSAASRTREEIVLYSTPPLLAPGAPCPVLGPLRIKELLVNWRDPSGGHSDGQGLEHMKQLKWWA